MLQRESILTLFVLLVLAVVSVYSCFPIYWVEQFFILPVNNIKLLREHYALSSHVVRTPIAVDAKGKIYIMFVKDNKVHILILNQKGKLERIIVPYLRNGQNLRISLYVSVSPSGSQIWTFEPWVRKDGQCKYNRITVHDFRGKAVADWLVPEMVVENHWRLFAYSESEAYAVVGGSPLICLRFTLGQKNPKRFEMSWLFYPIFFHNGKFVAIKRIEEITKQLNKSKSSKWNKQNEDKRLWYGMITWTPEEGIRLVKEFPAQSPIVDWIKWIDEQGNFYAYHRLPIDHLLTLLLRIGLIKQIFQVIGISDIKRRYVSTIQIFSPEGKLLDTIFLPAVVREKTQEKLVYGQLIKVDETGIYLEVERVSDPREYRIVKIVKKRRWQVWWERIRGKD